MKRNKKVIYKIYYKGRLIHDVYSDGSTYNHIGIERFDESIKDDLDFISRLEPETALSLQGDMINERYPRAFQAVCAITGGTPNGVVPFNGFTVEYFGEGEPRERAVPEGSVI